jgi:hypothetical protein
VNAAKVVVEDKRAAVEAERIRRELLPVSMGNLRKTMGQRETLLGVAQLLEEMLLKVDHEIDTARMYHQAVTDEAMRLGTAPNRWVIRDRDRSVKALETDISGLRKELPICEPGLEPSILAEIAAKETELERLQSSPLPFRSKTNLSDPPPVRDVLADFIALIVAVVRQALASRSGVTAEAVEGMVKAEIEKHRQQQKQA